MKKILQGAMLCSVLLLSSYQPAGGSTSDPMSLARESGFRVVLESDVAPQAFADCPAGYSCYWMNLNGGGSRWDAPQCGVYQNLPGVLNNNIESVRNRGGGTVHLYDGSDAAIGYMRSIVNNGSNVNLSNAHRNKTSSLRIDGSDC